MQTLLPGEGSLVPSCVHHQELLAGARPPARRQVLWPLEMLGKQSVGKCGTTVLACLFVTRAILQQEERGKTKQNTNASLEGQSCAVVGPGKSVDSI